LDATSNLSIFLGLMIFHLYRNLIYLETLIGSFHFSVATVWAKLFMLIILPQMRATCSKNQFRGFSEDIRILPRSQKLSLFSKFGVDGQTRCVCFWSRNDKDVKKRRTIYTELHHTKNDTKNEDNTKVGGALI
jgi:hypothetical protein